LQAQQPQPKNHRLQAVSHKGSGVDLCGSLLASEPASEKLKTYRLQAVSHKGGGVDLCGRFLASEPASHRGSSLCGSLHQGARKQKRHNLVEPIVAFFTSAKPG
tara:strand:- start:3881 stop:4192 length:312 start_codon:yes stop_codon:yes gene_type:complete